MFPPLRIIPAVIVATALCLAHAGDDDQTHWAFKPLDRQSVPEPPLPMAGVDSEIDAFLQLHHASAGLEVADLADSYTLVRRVTIDLTGLPPRFEAMTAFQADESPNAYERLVDRLLASPHYGERWGRHWLDVARYADNKGYVFEEERRFPYSYTYRDWVVKSLNEDLPYDQFLVRQIAGDHVAKETGDPRAQAALGFLTLGRRFLNREPDIIDDRIDVMTRGMLGLTVSCARCHDHKYDPIPTQDYYSLYGVFASSEEPSEKPLLGEPDEADPVYRRFKAKERELEEKLDGFFNERHAYLRSEDGVRDYLKLCLEGRDLNDDQFSSEAQKRKLYQRIARAWRSYLGRQAKENHPVFTLWGALSTLPDDAFAAQCTSLLEGFSEENADPIVLVALREAPPKSVSELIDRYARLLSSSPLKERILEADESPVDVEPRRLYRLFNTPDQQEVRRMRREIEKHRAQARGAPARAMALIDKSEPVEPRVFIRGDARRPGETVPRRFLAAISDGEREPFKDGSGRFELAQAIASTGNPLTARVLVNRAWMHHFGEPIVDSPSDFGVRTKSPALRDVLDHLAGRFMYEDGWSLKRLHRRILLSQAYRRGIEASSSAREKDPENRLWSHRKPMRLGFEAIRDSLLAVSDELDRRLGGRPSDMAQNTANRRRTLYGFIDRQNLPALFRTFDFATPDAHSPRRHQTTVPQQALYFMNSAFIEERADALGARAEAEAEGDLEAGVSWLHRTLLACEPDEEERQTATDFIRAWTNENGEPSTAGGWRAYAQALLSSNASIFVD